MMSVDDGFSSTCDQGQWAGDPNVNTAIHIAGTYELTTGANGNHFSPGNITVLYVFEFHEMIKPLPKQ